MLNLENGRMAEVEGPLTRHFSKSALFLAVMLAASNAYANSHVLKQESQGWQSIYADEADGKGYYYKVEHIAENRNHGALSPWISNDYNWDASNLNRIILQGKGNPNTENPDYLKVAVQNASWIVETRPEVGTELFDGVSLEVHDGLLYRLGPVVDFKSDNNILTVKYHENLKLSDDPAKWSMGSAITGKQTTFNSHEYSGNVIVADGSNSAAGSKFVITDEEQSSWKDYSGWLRISNTGFDLRKDDGNTTSIFSPENNNENNNAVGLSIGSGGTVFVKNQFIHIDRLGWSSTSKGDNLGVLDLTAVEEIEGIRNNQGLLVPPILVVNELHVQGEGAIKITDPTNYLKPGSVLTQGSALDYQVGANCADNHGNPRFQLIQANEVIGDLDSNITLITESGTTQSQTRQPLLSGGDSGQQVAIGTWDYTTYIDYSQGGEGGVYLTYALTALEVLNDQTLRAPTAFVIDLDQAQHHNELWIPVSGEGIVHVTGDEGKTLKITNTGNTFKGLMSVAEGIELTVLPGALGVDGETTVQLADGASLNLEESSTGDQIQTINGFRLSEGSVINLAEDTVLKVSGNTSTMSYARSDFSNVFTKGQLAGDGTLLLADAAQATYYGDEADTITTRIITEDTSVLNKIGTGELSFGYALDGQNINVVDGALVLKNGDNLGTLSFNPTALTRSSGNGRIIVDGLSTIDKLDGANSGTFEMAFNFGAGSQETLVEGKPGLKITEGSGNHFLHAVAADTNKGAKEKIKFAEVASGDVNFSLVDANGQAIDAVTSGAYDYTIQKVQGDAQTLTRNNDSGSDFYLTSTINEQGLRAYTVNAGSYIAAAAAADLFELPLHDRVGNHEWINPVTGEKEGYSLWMHQKVSREQFRDTSDQIGVRSTSSVTMLGGDIVQLTDSANGYAYAGAMAGWGTMDVKSSSRVTHLRSKADTDAWAFGVYGGWKANQEGPEGAYIDGWLLYNHAKSDIRGTDIKEEVTGSGLTASLEAGWGFHVGSFTTDSGRIADVHLEPYAMVTWFGMQYDDVHNDAHDVTFEGKDNVRTRLGARLVLSERDNDNFSAFAQLNWVHNTQAYGVNISGIDVEQAGVRNLAEGRLGVNWKMTDRFSIWGEFGVSVGDDHYNEREGSIGARYQF